jgi:hypothetical protein
LRRSILFTCPVLYIEAQKRVGDAFSARYGGTETRHVLIDQEHAALVPDCKAFWLERVGVVCGRYEGICRYDRLQPGSRPARRPAKPREAIFRRRRTVRETGREGMSRTPSAAGMREEY